MKIQLRTEVVALPPRVVPLPRVSTYRLLYWIDVRPSRASVFESYVRRLVESAERLEAPQRWRSYQVVSGGSSSRYLVEIPFERHAEKENWLHPVQALVAAFGAREGLRLHLEGSSAIQRTSACELRYAPELSGPCAGRHARRLLLRRTGVRLEQSGDYERFLRELRAAEAFAGAPPAATWTLLRGAQGSYVTTIPFDGPSEIDAWPERADALSDFYGREEASRLLELERASVSSREELELCLRPELGRRRRGIGR